MKFTWWKTRSEVKKGKKQAGTRKTTAKNVHEYEQLYRHVHTQSFANWSLSPRNKSIEKRCLRWYLQWNYFPTNEFFDQEASAWLKQKEQNIGPAACRQMLKLNWPWWMKILKLKISTSKKVVFRSLLTECLQVSMRWQRSRISDFPTRSCHWDRRITSLPAFSTLTSIIADINALGESW